MSRVIDANHAEPVIRAMVGAADVDTGPTAEQLAVIGALAAGYFEVDLDPAAVESLSPQATAAAFVEPEQRRRVRELLVLVELCRHPSSPSQAARIEEYCAALGESGPGLVGAQCTGDFTTIDHLARAHEPLAEVGPPSASPSASAEPAREPLECSENAPVR